MTPETKKALIMIGAGAVTLAMLATLFIMLGMHMANNGSEYDESSFTEEMDSQQIEEIDRQSVVEELNQEAEPLGEEDYNRYLQELEEDTSHLMDESDRAATLRDLGIDENGNPLDTLE